MIFAVLGGDMRQMKLAQSLAADGHEVRCFAFDRLDADSPMTRTRTALDAAGGAECVILPLPVTGKELYLNTPLSDDTYHMDEIIKALRPGQYVCGGKIPEELFHRAAREHITLVDYFDREELNVLNAVATAEGAIQLAMRETPITLFESECLVVGYGRIGKLLAHRLRGLGAHVTVSARKYSDFAWIRAFGYRALATGALSGRLGSFDLVFNTVPAEVLGEKELGGVKRGCLCIDLASKPGGVNFAAAAELGVHTIWALGLPGETAPESAGVMIKQTIYNILGEYGVLVENNLEDD